jgi:hypothetical protein
MSTEFKFKAGDYVLYHGESVRGLEDGDLIKITKAERWVEGYTLDKGGAYGWNMDFINEHCILATGDPFTVSEALDIL